MFAQAHYPSEPLSPEELDQYLSAGWFRMGQTIFTCTYLGVHKEIYRVIWLRVVLNEFNNDKKLQKLAKLNCKFNIKIQKASITPEKEALFEKYKSGIAFDASPSLEQLLNGGSEYNIYNTLEIELYDQDKLIAVGYFDVGKDSAAGISCFYDPAYKKYSLGKFLIYQKMMYCKNIQIPYFYLGYFAQGYSAFDYKLEIGKDSIEYFHLPSQKWHGIHAYDPIAGSIEETKQKLTIVQQQLNSLNIENRLLRYNYFQANLFTDFQGYELFDYNQFIYCFPFHPEVVNPIIVFDLRDQQYHLLHCISFGRSDEPNDHTIEYSAHLLKIAETIYSTPNVKELTEMMAKTISN
jgi:arginine-tRNA-protein transferase